jgi:hypothetical protein
MNNFKILFSFMFFASVISCGKNEPDETEQIETNYTQTSNITTNNTVNVAENTEIATTVENTEIEDTVTVSDADSGLAAAIQRQIPTSTISENGNIATNSSSQEQIVLPTPPVTKKDAIIVDTPLKILLRNGQLGKTYTKKELIEQYKFPKEAVDLIKQVTCVGPNKLYFKWGSTWLVEKVSDAEFENDTMIFTFKKNKTYVSGGAIGIKYNKKIYTELILNNGSAYIPSVKGYHWEINK